MEPIAYLALEIKQRELESRILIAAHLLKAGVAVVLGQQWVLFANADTCPPGVALFKTVNHIQANKMASFRASGHLVAATDEEVLVCTEGACFLEVFSPLAAESCDLFFAQSDFHKSVVENRFPALRGRTQTVGNARIDLLSADRRKSFDPEVQDIVKTYGPYILFNTSYGQLNSIWKDMKYVNAIAAVAGLVDRENPESVAEYRAKLEWERRNRDEMVELLRWVIEEIPSKNIVLRPHPGEAPEFWAERFGACERLHIIPRSKPQPWILGADMVVHTSCTTGLEAALMGRPVVNLFPVAHPTFDFITNHVNPTFTTWQEAGAAMVAFAASDGPIAERSQQRESILASHFAMNGKEATEKIADGLVALLRDHGAGVSTGEIPQFRAGGFKRGTRNETTVDKFLLEPDELSRRLQSALADIGAFLNVKMLPLDDSLFVLLPN
jgi:surface carbohydrate biosynthesis protein